MQKKKHAKRINPNRIICTQADVNRAEDAATSRAIEGAFKMVLYILLDKHDAPPDDVQQLSMELEWLANSLYSTAPGHLTWNDVDRVLADNKVGVRFTHDRRNNS